MKFREFMANSLPRRKKKKDSVSPMDDPRPFSMLECPDYSSDKRVTYNPSLVTDDFKYISDKLRPLALTEEKDRFKLNFNISIVENKCACYKHLDPWEAQTEHITEKTRPTPQRLPLEETCLYNTVPRVRTRIRTNPWLPSPRSSPAQTPSASPHSSVSASPMTSDRLSMNSSVDSAFVSQTNSPDTETFTNQLSGRCDLSHSSDVDSVLGLSLDKSSEETELKKPENELLQMSFISCETDNSVTANEHYFPGLDLCSPSSSCENLKGEDIALLQRGGERAPDISFDYEEAFESQIERKSVGQYLGSHDDLESSRGVFSSREDISLADDTSRDVHSEDSLDDVSSVSESTASECSYVMSGDYWNDFDSGDTDETLCEEEIPTKMSQSFSAYGCLERRPSYDLSEKLFPEFHDFDPESDPPRKRKLPKEEMSFHEKIDRLRQEKFVVNEKIRRSQEEERIQLQEKMRFQKQITMYRKEILLRTLADLKSKLEVQSQRLQSTYNNVLKIQWDYAREKVRTDQNDLKEAPF